MTRSDIHRQGSHVYSVPALLPAALGDRDGVILAKVGNTQSAEPADFGGTEKPSCVMGPPEPPPPCYPPGSFCSEDR